MNNPFQTKFFLKTATQQRRRLRSRSLSVQLRQDRSLRRDLVRPGGDRRAAGERGHPLRLHRRRVLRCQAEGHGLPHNRILPQRRTPDVRGQHRERDGRPQVCHRPQ